MMSPDSRSPSKKKFFSEIDGDDVTPKALMNRHDSKLQVVEELKSQEREKLESIRES